MIGANTKTNKPAMIFLVLGLITIAFPLYLTVVIAFKQPSEMTNSISAKFLESGKFPGSYAGDGFLEFSWQQSFHHIGHSCSQYCDPFHDRICHWKK